MSPLIIIVAVGAVVFLMVIGIYNGLVALRNQVKNSFSQIDVQLKRRYDLIPNLVETVKGYMKHEQETLQQVISARNQAHGAQQKLAGDPTDHKQMQQLMGAEAQLSAGLGRLMVVAEAYPELRASENMARLQEELSSTENKITFARQNYNDTVTLYNTTRESFPKNVIAGFFSFRAADLWEIEVAAEREAVKVKFT